MTRRSAEGFTLIELLVVLTLIGLLLVAMPSFIGAGRAGIEARAAARALADDLRAMRSTAMLTHRPAQISLFPRAGRYVLEPGDIIRQLPSGLVLEFAGARRMTYGERADIRFFPDGSSTGGEVRLSNGKAVYRVAAHWLTGRVSIDD